MEWRSQVSFLAKTVDIRAGLFLDVNGVAVNKKTKLFDCYTRNLIGPDIRLISLDCIT